MSQQLIRGMECLPPDASYLLRNLYEKKPSRQAIEQVLNTVRKLHERYTSGRAIGQVANTEIRRANGPGRFRSYPTFSSFPTTLDPSIDRPTDDRPIHDPSTHRPIDTSTHRPIRGRTWKYPSFLLLIVVPQRGPSGAIGHVHSTRTLLALYLLSCRSELGFQKKQVSP